MNLFLNKKTKGLSLLETVIYTFIGILIIIVISEIFVNQSNLGQKRTSQSDLEKSAGSGIENIKTAVQGARTVVLSRPFGNIAYTSDEDTLILEIPSVNGSGNIISGSYDYMVFFIDPLDSSLLKATTEPATGSARPGNTRIISSSVSTVEFRYNKVNTVDSTALDATIITSKTLGTGVLAAKAHAKVNLRNKR